MAMEVEDSKNDLEVGLDNDFLIFKPFIEVVQIFIDIPLSIAAWGLPKPCNGGKINRHLKETRFLNLH